MTTTDLPHPEQRHPDRRFEVATGRRAINIDDATVARRIGYGRVVILLLGVLAAAGGVYWTGVAAFDFNPANVPLPPINVTVLALSQLVVGGIFLALLLWARSSPVPAMSVALAFLVLDAISGVLMSPEVALHPFVVFIYLLILAFLYNGWYWAVENRKRASAASTAESRASVNDGQ